MGGMKQSVLSRQVGSLTGKWHFILAYLPRYSFDSITDC